MKRFLVFITAIWAVVAGSSASAQGRYGVLAGVDAHKLGSSPFSFPGATVGAFAESEGILGSGFRFKAELEYSYSPEHLNYMTLGQGNKEKDVVRRNLFHQISVPVMLEYCFLNGRLKVVAGESIAFAPAMIEQNVTNGELTSKHTYKFHDSTLEFFRNYFFAGVEYDLSDRVGLRLRYSLGVPDSGSDINFNKGLHLGVNIYL